MVGIGPRHFEFGPDNPDMRLSVWTPSAFEQLLELPMGTEIVLFSMAPGGVAMAGVMLTVNDAMRAQTQAYINEGQAFTFDFAVYLLPDDVVPDEPPVSVEEPPRKDN